MTKAFSAAATASALVLLIGVGTGVAADEKKSRQSGQTSQTERMSSQADRDRTSQGSQGMSLSEMKGMHTMEGEVTKIDHNTGKFSVKTQTEGTLDLHVPPSALQGVKKGDRVAVAIGINPSVAGATSGQRSSTETGGGAGVGAGGAAPTERPSGTNR